MYDPRSVNDVDEDRIEMNDEDAYAERLNQQAASSPHPQSIPATVLQLLQIPFGEKTASIRLAPPPDRRS